MKEIGDGSERKIGPHPVVSQSDVKSRRSASLYTFTFSGMTGIEREDQPSRQLHFGHDWAGSVDCSHYPSR